MNKNKNVQQQLSEFRFGIIGKLLANPPSKGELASCLKELSQKKWFHPIKQIHLEFSQSTLERWYYKAKNEELNSVAALSTGPRTDRGHFRVFDEELKLIVKEQYHEHSSWSWLLHYDELKAKLKNKIHIYLPSYQTVRRYMQIQGLYPIKKKRNSDTPGAWKARVRLEKLETRSFEVEFVGGLWHLDFHHGRRLVLNDKGEWITPIALAIIDDHSRFICHLQWFEQETAEVLVHGFIQALEKRGVPRALMTDNGPAMNAAEFKEGLVRLGVLQEFTMPYSPQQNAKIEKFWGFLEGRCMAMMENIKNLTLTELNRNTYAWVEQEYNQKVHVEIKCTPSQRFYHSQSVMRECCSHQELINKFRAEVYRKQRRFDSTLMLEGRRYEIPSQFRNLKDVCIHYARWAPNNVHLVDPQTKKCIVSIVPLNKNKNAHQMRAHIMESNDLPESFKDEPSKLLQQYLADMAATGLPIGVIPLRKENK